MMIIMLRALCRAGYALAPRPSLVEEGISRSQIPPGYTPDILYISVAKLAYLTYLRVTRDQVTMAQAMDRHGINDQLDIFLCYSLHCCICMSCNVVTWLCGSSKTTANMDFLLF